MNTDAETVELTPIEEIEKDKERFFSILKDTFEETQPDRYAGLMKMYAEFDTQLTDAPASAKAHYHYAFAGGYLAHVLHVYDCAIEQAKMLKKAGGLTDFTKAELTMAALHHDLWKLGMPGKPYYLPQTSDWHRKNQGEMFKYNEYLPYMKVTDGAVFLIQKYGVSISYNEWIGIKFSDGLYDESNKAYMINFRKFSTHTNLGEVIHWADHMATVAERDPLKQEFLAGAE